MSTKRLSLKGKQAGIASLLFSMVMMIVISLIVLSFAQVARRGQRESLDSQLSNQAYYAAESGVNDAVYAIGKLLKTGTSIDNAGCDLNANYAPLIGSRVLNSATNVSYSCLKVDSTPRTLSDTLNTKQSTIFTIEPDGGAIETLKLTWKPSGNPAAVSSCPSKMTAAQTADFKPVGTWACPYGLVRFDLVPTSGTLSRAGLQSSAMTVFAVPTTNGTASIAYKSGTVVQQGVRADALCTGTTCTLTVSGLSGYTRYAMRAISMYSSANEFTLTGQTAAAPTTNVPFKNGQAVIDATGKAQDVSRRMQVRLPLGGINGGYADYALNTTDDICKRFAVAPPAVATDQDYYQDYCVVATPPAVPAPTPTPTPTPTPSTPTTPKTDPSCSSGIRGCTTGPVTQ